MLLLHRAAVSSQNNSREGATLAVAVIP